MTRDLGSYLTENGLYIRHQQFFYLHTVEAANLGAVGADGGVRQTLSANVAAQEIRNALERLKGERERGMFLN